MTRQIVLLPAYNPGPLLERTVREVLGVWDDVWVVDDGSTDGSVLALLTLRADHPGLRVVSLPKNSGKGAAVLAGSREALASGFTHALVMDSDGQHPVDRIRPFLAASRESPDVLIVGKPVFGPDAPPLRLKGRKLSIGLVRFELMGDAVEDPLFGFRVYPLAPLVSVMESTPFARRYDFDPEVAVRLVWSGVPTRNLEAPCRYLSAGEGGVSHFRYVRDNIRMVWLHTRLIAEFVLWRWIALRRRRSHRR